MRVLTSRWSLPLILLVMGWCACGERANKSAQKQTPPSGPTVYRPIVESLGVLAGRALTPPTQRTPPWITHYGPDYTGIVDTAVGEKGQLFVCSGVEGLIAIDAADPVKMKTRGFLGPQSPEFTHLSGADGHSRCDHLTVAGETLWVSHQSDAFLRPSFIAAYDVKQTDPKPTLLHLDREMSFGGLDAKGDVVFVAQVTRGVGIYRRTAATLTPIGTVPELREAHDLVIAGSTLYVAGGAQGLTAVDVTRPEAPKVVARLPKAQGRRIEQAGGIVAVAGGVAGVVIVDISKPTQPRVASTIDTPGLAARVAYSPEHKVLWVADWYEVRAFDLRAMDRPQALGAVRIGLGKATTLTLAVSVRGDVVFVGDWYGVHSFRMHPKRRAPRVGLSRRLINLRDAGAEITIRNEGSAPLEVGRTQVSNGALNVTPKTWRLGPGAAQRVKITRKPDGAKTEATLTFHTNDPLEPQFEVQVVSRPTPKLGPQDLRFRTRKGTQWLPSSQRGKTVLLAYFSSYCPPCFLEFPEIERRVWQRFKDRGDVAVIGVASPADTPTMIQHFISQTGITFPVVFAPQPPPRHAARPEELITYYPFDVILDPSGRVVDVSTVIDIPHLVTTISRLTATQR